MIAQCKGKDLKKVPKSKLKEGLYLVGIKYDGHYTQIHKVGDEVIFYTSGGERFHIDHVARDILDRNKGVDFIIEQEYICNTKGMRGDRGKAAKLTTYRTKWLKGHPDSSLPGDDKFKLFDVLYLKRGNEVLIDIGTPFNLRESYLSSMSLGPSFESVPHVLLTLEDAEELSIKMSKDGYEGMFCKHPTHVYSPGKRVNDAIKLKPRPTADLLCVDIEWGDGKYSGMIGSLVLRDKSYRFVKVGSGLSDDDRLKEPDHYIGRVIEIGYEQIMDTYQQPTYVGLREKTKEEID